MSYVCIKCDTIHSKRAPKCYECKEWNTIIEAQVAMPAMEIDLPGVDFPEVEAVSIADVAQEDLERMESGIAPLDLVLGGGLVMGSIILLSGEPGIGKSTLLTQLLYEVSVRHGKSLYVTGEESVGQTAIRAHRIGAVHEGFMLLAETRLELILELANRSNPRILTIDSIQTVHTDELDSRAGTVHQVRECAAQLMTYAKTTGVPVVLVGHVTKDGMVAGPKTLEHVVDTVLEFRGEEGKPERTIHVIKNRFGSTLPVGNFLMGDTGLIDPDSPHGGQDCPGPPYCRWCSGTNEEE